MENLEEVMGIASAYFDNLFQASDHMEECLNAIQSKITDDMREVLSSEYTVEEVKVALFQMGPTKAPGLDGMLWVIL